MPLLTDTFSTYNTMPYVQPHACHVALINTVGSVTSILCWNRNARDPNDGYISKGHIHANSCSGVAHLPSAFYHRARLSRAHTTLAPHCSRCGPHIQQGSTVLFGPSKQSCKPYTVSMSIKHILADLLAVVLALNVPAAATRAASLRSLKQAAGAQSYPVCEIGPPYWCAPPQVRRWQQASARSSVDAMRSLSHAMLLIHPAQQQHRVASKYISSVSEPSQLRHRHCD